MFSGTGFTSLLKDGARHFTGDDARYTNIDAVTKLSNILRTSMGPDSSNKMVVNHIDKIFVTADAATIVEQLEVDHPSAKAVVQAAQIQAQEFGDLTNFVLVFAGDLLYHASELMKQGVNVNDVIEGYELALVEVEKYIESLCLFEAKDLHTAATLSQVAFSALSSKIHSNAKFFSELVGTAVESTLAGNINSFNSDNIRTIKIPGCSLLDSTLVHGLVLTRPITSRVKMASHEPEKPLKVLILSCDLAHATTDTTGNVLLNTAEELKAFTSGEDSKMKDYIQSCVNRGVRAIVVGGNISDIAQHFCDKFGLVTFKVTSKFELRRLCRTLNGPAMHKLLAPNEEDVGRAKLVEERFIGSTKTVVVEALDSKCSTIVLRGSTNTATDEVERAVDDAMGVIEACKNDNRFVAGGGAVDMNLSLHIEEFAKQRTGLDQYSCKAYAEALQLVPKTLIENSGANKNKVLAELHKAHKNGRNIAGIDLLTVAENDLDLVRDMYKAGRPMQENILQHLLSKRYAIKFASDVATRILSIDHIIMAKPAGGPKLPNQGHWDGQDDKVPMAQ